MTQSISTLVCISCVVRIQTSGSVESVSHQQFQLAFIQSDSSLGPEQLSTLFSNKLVSARRMILRCGVERAEVTGQYQNGDTGQATISLALRERVATLEDRIHNLYQILGFQAVIIIAAVLYKIFL